MELLQYLYKMFSKITRISVFNLDFRPFPVRVRLRRHRRVFAPHQDLFRTVDKTQKFQPEVELSPYLYMMFSKIVQIKDELRREKVENQG